MLNTDSTKTSEQGETSFLLKKSQTCAISTFEPLREGDDVDLNTEKSNNEKNHGMAGSRTSQHIGPSGKTATSTSQQSSRRKQKLLLSAVVMLVLIIAFTSTATIVVFLHWNGSVAWIPELSSVLREG